MMFRRRFQMAGVYASGVALLLAIVPAAIGRQAVDQAPTQVATENNDGKQKSIDTLRQEFYGAENEFYGLFNAVNSDDEFDVDCRDKVPFGRKDRVHACKADFLWKYEAKVAAFYSRRMSGVGAKSPPDAEEVDEKQALLRNEITAAISGNPEVQRSYARLVEAKKNYEVSLQDQ